MKDTYSFYGSNGTLLATIKSENYTPGCIETKCNELENSFRDDITVKFNNITFTGEEIQSL